MSAMPVLTFKKFLHSLIAALSDMPEQSAIRDILQKITDGEGIISREIFPTINAIFVTYDCLHLSADEALAIKTLDQLEELHVKAGRIRLIQSFKAEWEILIS